MKPLGVALLLYDRTAPQEKQEARTETAGFLLRVSKKRRYADLGYLLPFYLRLAIKTRCIGPSSWDAIYIYVSTVRTIGYPIAHIGSLMRRAEQQKIRPHRFLDLNQSEIIKLLQTKLW